jgi:hypothetical protein
VWNNDWQAAYDVRAEDFIQSLLHVGMTGCMIDLTDSSLLWKQRNPD